MPDLPSGPWTGYYNYRAGGRKHRMDLSLTFGNGRISGDGSDDVARFVLAGGYNESEGECYWTKTYIGAHTVYYRGFRERKGIWGVWQIDFASGGFHIWPLGEEEAEEVTAEIEEAIPAKVTAPVVVREGALLTRDRGSFCLPAKLGDI